MTLNLDASQLVLIDVQEKLCAAMPEANLAPVLKNTEILLQANQLLEKKALVTEQYPQGLGHTLPSLQAHLDHARVIEKTAFSAAQVPQFIQSISRDVSQVVLAGMEAHICVLQTALDLLAMGKQVFVVEDAVISRADANVDNAMQRLRQAGCIVITTESVVFEWIGGAQHPQFKAIAKLIR